MNGKYSILLALFAGFAGGFVSHYLAPPRAYAQVQASAHALSEARGQASPLAEIRAQKFVLVDEKGIPRGVFGIENNGAPVVEITDSKNRVFVVDWDRAGHTIFLGGPNCPRHPTLLPGN
ncbi:MAG: hypothetical protein ACREDR_13275 [Blastocatellia bacterium]